MCFQNLKPELEFHNRKFIGDHIRCVIELHLCHLRATQTTANFLTICLVFS